MNNIRGVIAERQCREALDRAFGKGVASGVMSPCSIEFINDDGTRTVLKGSVIIKESIEYKQRAGNELPRGNDRVCG